MTLAPPPKGLPPAYGSCTCSCHHVPGIMHMTACCSPLSFTMPTDPEWYREKAKLEGGFDISAGVPDKPVAIMVLVPREPTDEMLQAFEDEYVCMFGAAPPSPWSKAEKLYAAMLAAAPNASKDADDVNAEYEVNFLDSQGGGNG